MLGVCVRALDVAVAIAIGTVEVHRAGVSCLDGEASVVVGIYSVCSVVVTTVQAGYTALRGGSVWVGEV